MKTYLFIPYNPADAEIFKVNSLAAFKREWRKRAKQSTARCTLFEFDTREPSGLRLTFSVADGEISDATGEKVGAL